MNFSVGLTNNIINIIIMDHSTNIGIGQFSAKVVDVDIFRFNTTNFY